MFLVFKSSIGKKAVMAFTGMALFVFVVVHMLGNLQIFLGAEALNSYAQHLKELSWLVWPARILLLAVFILHIFVSISLAVENRRARPVTYAYKNTVQASYASRTMVVSGILILLFVIYHLMHYTFGAVHAQHFGLTDSKGRHDVYAMVVLGFRNPWISGVYVAAMAVLCQHLGHGLQSLFQSLGLNGQGSRRPLQKLSAAVALLIFIGNSSIPVAAFFGFLKLS